MNLSSVESWALSWYSFEKELSNDSFSDKEFNS